MFTVEINLTLSDCSVILFLCFFYINCEYTLQKGIVIEMFCPFFMFWNTKVIQGYLHCFNRKNFMSFAPWGAFLLYLSC